MQRKFEITNHKSQILLSWLTRFLKIVSLAAPVSMSARWELSPKAIVILLIRTSARNAEHVRKFAPAVQFLNKLLSRQKKLAAKSVFFCPKVPKIPLNRAIFGVENIFLKKMSLESCKIEKFVVILRVQMKNTMIQETQEMQAKQEMQENSKSMLDAFFRIHDFLVAQAQMPIRRLLMDEIDWNDRLIAIKGGRGIGKTDFLLTRAKEIEEQDRLEQENAPKRRRKNSTPKRLCLYVNLNNFYFTENSLVTFAGEFVKAGGHTLLIDQTFKYPNWSRELRRCYKKYRNLHIVFVASPVMRLIDENKDLGPIVKMYNLRGFSFREYLCLKTGIEFEPVTLEMVLKNHASISRGICDKLDPMEYFKDYLRHGYYPAFLKHRNFEAELLKQMNMMLEVDVLMIKQIEVSNLPKMRKLLHIMLMTTPCPLNITSISEAIDTSRATTMNYIKYLKEARLLNLLFMEGKTFPMKPTRVYMQNTNIAYMCIEREPEEQDLYETFFYNMVHVAHKINATERNAMFVVDGKYYFDVKVNEGEHDCIRPTAIGNLQMGLGNSIPLWLLGFLY